MIDPSQKPIVSIISFTYNHAPYIRFCLDGMLKQKTNFIYEIIIHDDASTDGTSDIIREYAKKYPELIKPIIQQQNQYSLHHNFANILDICIKKSSGKYIALCEGDDFWINPTKLQKQYDILEANKDIAISFHNANVINLVNGEKHPFINKLREGKIPYWKLVLLPWCTPTASFFFRTSCISGIKQPEDINTDMFILFTCGVKGQIYYWNEIASVYRYGTPGSTSDIALKTSYIPVYKKKISLMRYINRITNNRFIFFTYLKSLLIRLKIIKFKIFDAK